MLASPDPRARAAAVRVLSYWRDRVPNALALLKTAAGDGDARVRLQAVRAASFFPGVPAVEVALAAAQQPTDYYLDYVLTETLRQLEPTWRKAIADGVPLFANNTAGMKLLLGKLSAEETLKLPRTPEVLAAIITRDGIPEMQRMEALGDLAQQRKTTVVSELLGALAPLANGSSPAAADLARILTRQPGADLKAARAQLSNLLKPGVAEGIRVSARAALIAADGSFEPSWSEAMKSAPEFTRLLEAVPRVSDPGLRATVHDKVVTFLSAVPPGLSAELERGANPNARYLRIELPRKGTLTLAEVQVFSGQENIAPSGTATQSSTAFGGLAKRAIDGNTSGDFGSGSETHTVEDENNPWWELDLGRGRAIDSVAIWNRNEKNGTYAKRLDGFTLTILDGERHELFKKTGIPAPSEKSEIAVHPDNLGAFRRAAIRAAVSTGGDPGTVFLALSKLIAKDEQVTTATEGIRALPRTSWAADGAAEAARAIVAWAKRIPASERTLPDNVAAVQLASDLAGRLPADQATEVAQRSSRVARRCLRREYCP